MKEKSTTIAKPAATTETTQPPVKVRIGDAGHPWTAVKVRIGDAGMPW